MIRGWLDTAFHHGRDHDQSDRIVITMSLPRVPLAARPKRT